MMEKYGMQEAQENLLYIRQTLEAAGQLTAVPGRSLIAAGILALAGAAVNGYITGPPWNPSVDARFSLAVWGGVLLISLKIVLFGIYRQSKKMHTPLRPPLVRKLLWSLCPSLFAGALFTGFALQTARLEWLPVIWLGCYGAAVTSSGSLSVAPVRYMGLSFLITALAAAVSSQRMGLAWIA
ncbi:MAG: hypothetical protein P8Z37_16870, partial [Acidobacteriota bacterium]